jgi:hypothetical protein
VIGARPPSGEPAASTPQVILASEDLVICHWDNLVLLVWMKRTRLHHLVHIRMAVEAARRANGNLLCLLQIVVPTAVIPDASARKALSEMLLSFEGIVSHSALVHLGSGFSASVVRSVVTAITALRRHGFPLQVFGTVQAAITWLERSNDAVRGTSACRIAQDILDKALGGHLERTATARSA